MTKRLILVTGATGFVGRMLCAELIRLGNPVRVALRDSANMDTADCELVKISSIDSDTDWTNALHGVTCAIHLAARVHIMRENAQNPLEEFRKVNVAGTEHLARSAAASGVKRLVYVSSIKVNGESTSLIDASALPRSVSSDLSKAGAIGSVFTENDAPKPQDAYGISKCEAEQVLHRVAVETGLEVVIVRPPLVYGAGVKGNFAQMLNVLFRSIPLPFASVHNLRSLVYVENLVDALIICAMHPAAVGQTYLISDGEDISTPDLLRQLGAAMGHPARFLPCPSVLLKLAGRLVGRSDQIDRLLGSLRIDSSKIRRELGWQPPYTLQQGLQATAEWYRSHRNGSA